MLRIFWDSRPAFLLKDPAMKSLLALALILFSSTAIAGDGKFTMEAHLASMECDRPELKELLLASFNADPKDQILYKVIYYVDDMTIGKIEWNVFPKALNRPPLAADYLRLELEISTTYYDEHGKRTDLEHRKHSKEKLIGFRVF